MELKSGSRLMPADGMHVAIEMSKGDFGTSNGQLYKSIYRFAPSATTSAQDQCVHTAFLMQGLRELARGSPDKDGRRLAPSRTTLLPRQLSAVDQTLVRARLHRCS
jgi:hypothetical protein